MLQYINQGQRRSALLNAHRHLPEQQVIDLGVGLLLC